MKTCKYIITESGGIFVQSPTSVMGGWARHKWLKQHFGKEVSIASASMWELLCEKYEVLELEEE